MSRREPVLYVEDILASINKIETYTRGMNVAQFIADEITFDAVIRNLIIIGEAVSSLPTTLKQEYPDVIWKNISGMRNIIIHEYFGVDPEIIWDTLTINLPTFKEQIIILSHELK